MPGSDGITTRTQQDGTSTVSVAEFSLRIPASGPSARMSMRVTPKAAPDLRLDVSVHAQGELYRTFSVRLRVQATSGEQSHRPTVRISRDTVFALTDLGSVRRVEDAARRLLLAKSASHVHRWCRQRTGQTTSSNGAGPATSGAIAQLQDAAERLRDTQAYLDHISDQIRCRPRGVRTDAHWSFPLNGSRSPRPAWAAVERARAGATGVLRHQPTTSSSRGHATSHDAGSGPAGPAPRHHVA